MNSTSVLLSVMAVRAEKTFEEGTSTQLTKISKEIAGKKVLY